MRRHGAGRRAVVAAVSVVSAASLLAGCSSGGDGPVDDTVAEATGPPVETTSGAVGSLPVASSDPQPSTTASVDTAATATVAMPADVCALFDAAAISALVGETVTGTAVGPGVCQFSGTDLNGMLPTVGVRRDGGGTGGLETAQAGAEGTVGGIAQPFDAAGAPGFLVIGGPDGPAVGAASIHGLLVTVAVVNGEPATKASTLAAMLRTAVGRL